ncbi:MAG: tyrosine-protein phosphatase [Victivallaceae bacterium]|nr:CpsB/CapC family capsule biosynthesis tyrosine phosphatase [Victivallaceae bacterium]
MIDLHSHVLWGVDDGPKELARSIKMLDLAKADGIDVLFTTSHYNKDLPDLLPQRLAELEPHAAERGIKLVPGTEVDYVYLADTRPLIPLGNSNFVLVDVRQPYLEISTEHIFSRVAIDGYRIIIAHPERLFMESNLKTVRELLEMDCLFQINAGSLAGFHGSHSKHLAIKIIESGLAHYVGSDAHSPRRTFFMTAARAEVEKRFGARTAELLFEENARQLLDGEAPFKVLPPKKKWYQFWR